MGALYKIDFPNGKSYVGITSGTAASRFKEHLKAAFKKNMPQSLSRALRKYGADAPTVKTLAICNDWPSLQLMEQNAIRVFGTFGHGGYNQTLGGEGFLGVVKTPATIAKISAAKKGVPQTKEAIAARSASMKGRTVSAETRRKISVANTGRKLSAETRARISQAGKARVASPETKAKLSAMQRATGPETRLRRRESLLSGGGGVYFDASRNNWQARITLNYKMHFLGRFATEAEARAVRDEATRVALQELRA